MIIPQNYSSSIFEILSNIDPLRIILLKLIDREEESRLWQDLRNVYLQTSALSYRNNVAISPSMLSNSRQHQPQFFSSRRTNVQRPMRSTTILLRYEPRLPIY